MASLSLIDARSRAASIAVHGYDLHLDLTDAESFESTSRVRFSSTQPTQFAELAAALTLTATLNGRPLPDDAYADGRLELTDLGAENELVVEARLPYVTNGDGMHVFIDPADGERYVSAYCGMDLASKVFACFDQPDLKAPISLTVSADPRWTVLGNGVGTGQDGRWTFTTTPPVPPYLFVVCAGPWHSVSWEHAGLPFGWHARASLADELERDCDELRRITEACFDHYARVFDEPFAFDSYDQVLVPGLNWGAMENPGCVTFRDEFLTRGEPTAVERLWRSTVIAHEMAHMWFGNLVTMRWWEDSWLNESFADYMGYQVAGAAAGLEGAWVGSALKRKPSAYVADARRSTHPVAEMTEAMVDVETAFGNFDMITYAKGNAVLQQLVTWLGEDGFLAGANAYLSAHPFGNATLDDFLSALAGANERDTGAWATAWLRTTGFDTIGVTRDGEVPVLQKRGGRPHRFRVGAYDDRGVLTSHRMVDLADAPVALPELAGLAVVPNDQEESYARIVLDDLTWRTVAGHLGSIADPLTRAMLWMNAVDRCAQGLLPVPDLVALTDVHLRNEADPLVVEGVLDIVLGRVLPQWTQPADLAAAEATLADVAGALLIGGAPEHRIAALRTYASTTSDADVILDWLETGRATDGGELPRDERWVVLRRLAELGRADGALVAREQSADQSVIGHLGALRANAAMPTAGAKADAWGRMTSPDTSNREYSALADGLWSLGQAALQEEWIERYLAESPALAKRRGQAFSQVIGRAFPFVTLDAAGLAGLRARLATALAGDVPTVLRRSWNDRLDDLDVGLHVRR